MDLIKEYEDKLPINLLREIEQAKEKYGLNQIQMKKVLGMVEEKFNYAKINSGEAIGTVTAESIGEPSTQMILRTFHLSGVAEVNVTLGLPRLIEIFDARKIPSTPMMVVYLKEPYNQDAEEVRKLALRIKETKLSDLFSEVSINLIHQQVEVVLLQNKLNDLNITKDQIMKTIASSIKKVEVVEENSKVVLKAKKVGSLMDLYSIKEKIKELSLDKIGVKGITQVLPVKQGDEFVIKTAGSNLKEIFKLEQVDIARTRTNDIFETAKILGIEAARQMIIDEANNVLHDQGLDVDIRHIMLIADLMTSEGTINGVTRSGITGSKESVLARVTFETPIKHLINASLIGEVDYLNSVIENVLVNQPIPLGTGLPDLVVKVKGDKDE